MSAASLSHWLRRVAPGADEQSQNFWNLYLEVGFFGFVFGTLQTFLNVYALRLGASNETMGWLNAMPSLVFALWAIPSAAIIERVSRRLRLIVFTSLLHRAGVLALALMPFVLTAFRPEAIVVIVTLMSFPQVIANVAFSSMFAEVVPAEHRPHVIAVRNTILGFTSTVASLGGGLFLGVASESIGNSLAPLFAFPLNFQVLFFSAFSASLLGVVYLRRIRPSAVHAVPSSAPPRLTPRLLRDLLQRSPAFSRYAFAMFVMHWGIFLPMPLFSIYWVRTLHSSDTFVGVILTVQSVVSMIVYPFLPRLDARFGSRGLLAFSLFLNTLYPLATAFTTTLEPLLLISVLGGVSNAMLGLGSFNLLLEVAPAAQRASYIALFNTALFSAGFFAPFVGTALLSVMSINQDLLVAAALRLTGVLTVVLLVGLSGKGAAENV